LCCICCDVEAIVAAHVLVFVIRDCGSLREAEAFGGVAVVVHVTRTSRCREIKPRKAIQNELKAVQYWLTATWQRALLPGVQAEAQQLAWRLVAAFAAARRNPTHKRTQVPHPHKKHKTHTHTHCASLHMLHAASVGPAPHKEPLGIRQPVVRHALPAAREEAHESGPAVDAVGVVDSLRATLQHLWG
jgi:hypothetical protein